MMYRSTRVARVEHSCENGDTIRCGERYVEDVYPPWTLTSDDPEGSPFPIGEWIRERSHLACPADPVTPSRVVVDIDEREHSDGVP